MRNYYRQLRTGKKGNRRSVILFAVIIIIALSVLLNLKVTTRKGIDYKVYTLKIPLFLKIIDFMDRHYNYGYLVKGIISKDDDNQERAMKIFAWTYRNIKRQPQSLPVIDDHPWYIVVRGYGESDQFSDIFTTLCNYAGVNAFYSRVDAQKHDPRIVLSFIKIKGRWRVFDPYNGVYFKNSKGELADIEQIVAGDWFIQGIDNLHIANVDYGRYLPNLRTIRNVCLLRPNIQSPIRRLQYEIKKWLR